MNVAAFEQSLIHDAPPAGIPAAVEALWHERRGDWGRAHEIAQNITTSAGAWVHAYLHRREGDESNAAYWYRQAGKLITRSSLDDEWRVIVETLLAESE